MIKLRVQWPNAGHPLLAKPDIAVRVDGNVLPALSQAPGQHDFEVPDGAAAVELQAVFRADLSVGDFDEETFEERLKSFDLLRMQRDFVVVGEALLPQRAVITGPGGSDASRVVHPLVQSVSAANAISGAALVQLRTDFVDMTAHWLEAAPERERVLFLADQDPDSDFVAAAATGAQPPLWFAHFRRGLEPPAPETRVLVFFRPHGHYTYDKANDIRHLARGLQDLNRYLLAPKDLDDAFEFDGLKLGRVEERFPLIDSYYPLRIGWQQAVIRSGKPLVVLHPWPTGGLRFGDALTSRLPSRIEEILRFLQGTGRVGLSHDALTLGRLGLAGYSAGGPPAAAAMKANRTLVKEMHLYDPFPFAAEIPFVVDWALRTEDFRLRMTGANFWGQMETLRRTVVAGVGAQVGARQRPSGPSARASTFLRRRVAANTGTTSPSARSACGATSTSSISSRRSAAISCRWRTTTPWRRT